MNERGTQADPHPGTRARVGTGNPEVDEILHGGFPAASINVLMGHPGTGKTILAEQVLFHNASPDSRALYLSTLSEPLTKILGYLQGFSFYDEEKMLTSVTYDDIGPGLLEHGISYVERRVREAIRSERPRIIVIDSFKAIHDLEDSESEMRRLVARLAGLLSAYGAMTLLVGEYQREDVSRFPEFAVADGIVELSRLALGRRDDRHLRVIKLRGSAYQEGMHAFTISADGLSVFPRTVTPPIPPAYSEGRDRVTSGTTGLDVMLGGGFWPGSSVLVAGPTGSGKTTLALGFAIEGVRCAEPTLYAGFQENPTQFARALGTRGEHATELSKQGLHAMYISPVELHIDSVVVQLFRIVREHGVRRLIIDALGDLAMAATDRERFHDFLYAVTQRLTSGGVTSMLTLETHEAATSSGVTQEVMVSSLVDTVITLGTDLSVESPRRWLRVVKARAISHPLRRMPMRIDAEGAHVDTGDENG